MTFMCPIRVAHRSAHNVHLDSLVDIKKIGTGEVNTIGVTLKNLKIPLSDWSGYDSEKELI